MRLRPRRVFGHVSQVCGHALQRLLRIRKTEGGGSRRPKCFTRLRAVLDSLGAGLDQRSARANEQKICVRQAATVLKWTQYSRIDAIVTLASFSASRTAPTGGQQRSKLNEASQLELVEETAAGQENKWFRCRYSRGLR